jgi:hypothetical protein
MRIRWVATILVLCSLLQVSNMYGSDDTVKYYPLKPGMTWTYSLLSDKSPTRTITVTNLPPREINGVTLTPRKWDKGGASNYYLVGTDNFGVYRYGEAKSETDEPLISQPKVYYLKDPVNKGTTWDIKTKLGDDDLTVNLSIESVNDAVKVPAGSYQDCLKVKHAGGNQQNGSAVSLEAYEWYAPGVGLVKSVVTIKKLAKKQPTILEHQTYQLESFQP